MLPGSMNHKSSDSMGSSSAAASNKRTSRSAAITPSTNTLQALIPGNKPVLLVTHDIWLQSIAQFHLTFESILYQQAMTLQHRLFYRSILLNTTFLQQQSSLLQELLPLFTLEGSNILFILQRFQSLLAYLLPTLPEKR